MNHEALLIRIERLTGQCNTKDFAGHANFPLVAFVIAFMSLYAILRGGFRD